MDRRQQKTRKAIYQAFTRLLEEKKYGSITVQEIIDEADIGRSTFYSHFETKDELLRELSTEIFSHVFSDELTKEKNHDFSAEQKDMSHRLTHILFHLQENRAYIKGILASESSDLFMRYFKEYLTKVFDAAIQEEDSILPRDYMLNHMVCDFAESVRWWMKHEEYSPEDIGSFYLATTPQIR